MFLLSKLLCVNFIFRGQAPAVFVHFHILLVLWESLDQIWLLSLKLYSTKQFSFHFSAMQLSSKCL